MENRINIGILEPEAYKAFMAVENYLGTTKISKTHKELIKIRASQINGCAFCINMHTKDARKHGETEQRIYLLNAWREVHDLYTEEERAILALTEEMTLIANGGVKDETYNVAKAFFDENQLAQIMVAIMAINAWNRMAIATHMQPA
ncbi:carboxymuconolactone decarboxylase family protein [Pedobacter boryungensis]|uniref:Carboxymuconolactone decarboxylase family protein n=1 Tax=Pedobacter boryungensis TaxID=869962 RepID=A0ABX2DCF3_9SPHI|nr:carboxymuconolactone decarboxylase family protein [Pedobacter boryungensis]NQX31745.1 carboxymuconolactone decarboxylase family protein [Pedobacter boryungensis]